jgi:hypothetical protein
VNLDVQVTVYVVLHAERLGHEVTTNYFGVRGSVKDAKDFAMQHFPHPSAWRWQWLGRKLIGTYGEVGKAVWIIPEEV